MGNIVPVGSRKRFPRSLSAPEELAQNNEESLYSDLYRTVFMRDRDRVLYSTPFRLLAGKTQVYISGINDNMRTRLTHTLEVAQIAKTISTNLELDVDLTEAIALGHDIGHTPYGHAGERILHKIMNPSYDHPIKHCPFDLDKEDNIILFIKQHNEQLGFKHNLHSIEVAITEAEKTQQRSLSLTNFSLYGMANHSSSCYKNDADEFRYIDGKQLTRSQEAEIKIDKVGYYKQYEKYCKLNKYKAWNL